MNSDTIETAEIVPNQALAIRPEAGAVGILRPADSLDRIADAFKEYQAVCERILNADDYQKYDGKPRKKKSAWRKLATAFNVSTQIVQKDVLRPNGRNVVMAEIRVRASTSGGRQMEAEGSCDVNEKCCAAARGQECHKRTWKGHYCCKPDCDGRKHWSHPDHDIISTAQTRATNRAIADLIGCGEVSAEELVDDEPKERTQTSTSKPKDDKGINPGPPPPKQPVSSLKCATAEYRAKMIENLKAGPGGANRQTVTEFFKKAGPPFMLMENQELESLELRFVPVDKEQMQALTTAIGDFEAGNPAKLPYRPNGAEDDDGDLGPQKPAPTKAPEPAADDDRLFVVGTVERVTVKEGTSKKGPWTLYGIKINGDWFNTFHANCGQQAQELEGRKAKLFYEMGEKGNTALAIEEV